MDSSAKPSVGSKGLIRSLSRRGTRSDKTPPVAQKLPKLTDPTICDRCGAVYSHKTWRQGRRLTGDLMAKAAWSTCPGCAQAGQAEYFGRVLIRGAGVSPELEAIRKRIRNVVQRATFTQPERRLVSEEWDGATLEVLTTSQKLAHRIAHELEKAFGGKASYTWSDEDGSLLATWRLEARREKKSARKKSSRKA